MTTTTTWLEKANEDRRQAAIDRVQARLSYSDGHWMWTGGTRGGYGKLSYRDATGKVRDVSAHRVMYERHVGPIPEGHDVHHKCYEPLCCRPDHLEARSGPSNQEDYRDLLKRLAAERLAELQAASAT